MTPRRQRILKFIRDYVAAHGFAPTLDEIAGDSGVTRVTAYEQVRALIRHGLLSRRRRFSARALKLTPAGERAIAPLTCPHCGQPVRIAEPQTEPRFGLEHAGLSHAETRSTQSISGSTGFQPVSDPSALSASLREPSDTQVSP